MMTYNQYVEFPDDGQRYEIIDGTLQMMTPAPSYKHQLIITRLASVIYAPCREEGIFIVSPFDVVFSQGNVRQPDFILILNENMHIISDRAVEGVPDIVGEILSHSTAKNDRKSKFETYQRFGVKEYWIVDPELELLEQFVLVDDKYVLSHVYGRGETVKTSLLKCLAVSMDDILG